SFQFARSPLVASRTACAVHLMRHAAGIATSRPIGIRSVSRARPNMVLTSHGVNIVLFASEESAIERAGAVDGQGAQTTAAAWTRLRASGRPLERLDQSCRRYPGGT